MTRFRLSTLAGASLGALALALAAPGSASAQDWGSSGGGSHGSLFSHGSSGGGSHGSLFSHGSSGGGSHGSLFSHGSSGGGSHGSLFSHGSSGGGSHGSLFSHGSSGGGSHGSLFSHGSSGGGSHGSLFSHGSSGGGSHGSLFSHGSSGGGSHGSMFSGHGSNGGSWGSAGGTYLGSNNIVMSPTTLVATTSIPAPVAQATTGVAYLNVTVPEDAKVYLQDQLMTVGGTERRFVTPEMQAGVTHLYTVKVEVVRDGQTVTKTAQAAVTAGQEIAVTVAFDAKNQQELVASVALLASL